MSQPPRSKGTEALDPSHPERERDDDLVAKTSVEKIQEMEEAPVRHEGRRGFLPIRTNTFDRVFIGVVLFVAIHLLWMRFVEAYLPLWVATILSILLGIWIVRKG